MSGNLIFFLENFLLSPKISKIICLHVDIFIFAFKVFHRPVESENMSLISRSLFILCPSYIFSFGFLQSSLLGLLFIIKVVCPISIHIFSHILSLLSFFLVCFLEDLLYFTFYMFIIYFSILFLISRCSLLPKYSF